MQERLCCEGNATDLLSSANLPKGRKPTPPCRRSQKQLYSDYMHAFLETNCHEEKYISGHA